MVRALPGLSNLLIQLPLLIVWIIGIIVALVRWSKHPRVSLVALIGLAVLFVIALVGGLLTPWLQMTLMRNGMSGSRVGLLSGIVGIVLSLIRAGAWGLILVAIFSKRETQDEDAASTA